jgi:hypothetical protein
MSVNVKEKSIKKCQKCGGSGWLWWNELEKYDGPAADIHDCYSDDTKYTCDLCNGKGKTMGVSKELK